MSSTCFLSDARGHHFCFQTSAESVWSGHILPSAKGRIPNLFVFANSYSLPQVRQTIGEYIFPQLYSHNSQQRSWHSLRIPRFLESSRAMNPGCLQKLHNFCSDIGQDSCVYAIDISTRCNTKGKHQETKSLQQPLEGGIAGGNQRLLPHLTVQYDSHIMLSTFRRSWRTGRKSKGWRRLQKYGSSRQKMQFHQGWGWNGDMLQSFARCTGFLPCGLVPGCKKPRWNSETWII